MNKSLLTFATAIILLAGNSIRVQADSCHGTGNETSSCPTTQPSNLFMSINIAKQVDLCMRG
jgi:hypothetical protein